MRTFDYDVIIAGGGVTGCAIARELSRYALDICLLEKEEDVCSGTSKANSAIVHAGFDAAPGSMKAQMNVAGSRLMPDLARELDVPFRQNGSMVLCLSPDDRPALEALYRRGLTNGVEGLSLLTGEEARALEPHLTQAVAGPCWPPPGGSSAPSSSPPPWRRTPGPTERRCAAWSPWRPWSGGGRAGLSPPAGVRSPAGGW